MKRTVKLKDYAEHQAQLNAMSEHTMHQMHQLLSHYNAEVQSNHRLRSEVAALRDAHPAAAAQVPASVEGPAPQLAPLGTAGPAPPMRSAPNGMVGVDGALGYIVQAGSGGASALAQPPLAHDPGAQLPVGTFVPRMLTEGAQQMYLPPEPDAAGMEAHGSGDISGSAGGSGAQHPSPSSAAVGMPGLHPGMDVHQAMQQLQQNPQQFHMPHAFSQMQQVPGTDDGSQHTHAMAGGGDSASNLSGSLVPGMSTGVLATLPGSMGPVATWQFPAAAMMSNAHPGASPLAMPGFPMPAYGASAAELMKQEPGDLPDLSAQHRAAVPPLAAGVPADGAPALHADHVAMPFAEAPEQHSAHEPYHTDAMPQDVHLPRDGVPLQHHEDPALPIAEENVPGFQAGHNAVPRASLEEKGGADEQEGSMYNSDAAPGAAIPLPG